MARRQVLFVLGSFWAWYDILLHDDNAADLFCGRSGENSRYCAPVSLLLLSRINL